MSDLKFIEYKNKKYKQVIFEGKLTKYYVSENGEVISCSKYGKIHELKVYETKVSERKSKNSKKCKHKKQGYLYVKLTIDNKSRCGFLHRLVAVAYLPNPYSKPEVNHLDGDHYNNYYKNLEWCTQKENKEHAKLNKLYDAASCEDHGKALYNNKDIYECCLLMEKKMN